MKRFVAQIFIALFFFSLAPLSAQVSSFPFKENFDSVVVPMLPLGWTTSTIRSVSGDFTSTTSTPRSSANAIISTDATKQQRLTSPPFDFTGKNVDSIEFYERRSATHTSGLLLEASINNDTSFGIQIGDSLKFVNSTSYVRRIFALPETLSNKTNVKFRWRVAGNGSGTSGTIRFDDISISVKKAIDLSVSSISISPLNPIKGTTLDISAVIINKAPAGNFSFVLQLFDSSTLVATKNITQSFTADESRNVFLQYPSINEGRHPLSVKLTMTGDEDTTNNRIGTTVIVGVPFQSIIINEIMYAPIGDMPEWIECSNTTSSVISINGWKISDATTKKATIQNVNPSVPAHSFFVVTTDTILFKNYFPHVTPIFAAPFSTLNNTTPDAVVLFDERGAAIDSVYYKPNWGGINGNSLQRFDASGSSADSANWRSTEPTPGTINKNTRKNVDVKIHRIDLSPQAPTVNQSLTINATIINSGRKVINNVTVEFYIDVNNDSVVSANEFQMQKIISSILVNDSSAISAQCTLTHTGAQRIFVKLVSAIDEDSTNNIGVSSIFVGAAPQSIVVTEIMYNPQNEIPEWIEFYNKSTSPISIAGWKLSDNGSTKTIITNSKIPIQPHSYFIVASDSTFENYYSVSVPLFVASFSALNNTTPDAVVLFDTQNRMNDSMYYRQSWGGTNGNSLQRFDIFSSSTDSSNWRSALPSAGVKNIVARKDFDVELRRIISTLTTNGTRISVIVFNSGRNTANAITIKLYHDSNCDSVVHANEFLSSLNISSIGPLDSAIVVYDWNVKIQGKQQIIVSIDFLNDERTQNNIGIATLTNNFPPQSLVINEIMYEPFLRQSEFVELFNRGIDTIDVADWTLMDQPSLSGSRSIISLSKNRLLVPPNNFVLVASDSSIGSQFPSLANQIVIVNSSLGLSNAGEDVILVDLTNTIIDSVHYFPSWHLKTISTQGRSLERINPALFGNDARNWNSSVASNGASPLKQNSIYSASVAPSTSLSLSPNPFSPDNDGYEDFLTINYTLPTNSSMIRVRIYDVTGRLVRRLATNDFVSSTGSLLWNGLDDFSSRVRIGMYIILFEALDNFGGVVRTMKDVAVVATKL